MISYHQILRYQFKEHNNKVCTYINTHVPFDIEETDLSHLISGEKEARFQEICNEILKQPFNLNEDILIRANLIHMSSQSERLLLVIPHIIWDGSSAQLFLKMLKSLYFQFSQQGNSVQTTESPTQYNDFVTLQQESFQSDHFKKSIQYWKDKLSNIQPTGFPADYHRQEGSFSGERGYFKLSEDLVSDLNNFNRKQNVTPFLTLLTALKVLLCHYIQQEDIVIGTVTTGREYAGMEELIGCFINTIVLRTQLPEELSFIEALMRVKETTIEAYTHQSVPFSKLVEILCPTENLAVNPLFQVMFVMQHPIKSRSEDWSFFQDRCHNGSSKLDLTFILQEIDDGISVTIEYRTDLFKQSTIKAIYNSYTNLLKEVVRSSDRCITKFSLLNKDEKQILLMLNQGKVINNSQQQIHQLIEKWAHETPKSLAVKYGDIELTYEQLNKRANTLAHHLRKLGVSAEVLVDLCIDRSIEAIVSVLAILKAGGVFIPLDPNIPRNRLNHILNDTQPLVILTQTKYLGYFSEYNGTIIDLSNEIASTNRDEQENLVSMTKPHHLAYVIYTSGTTGVPKGVMIEHRNLLNLIQWHQETFNLSNTDRLSQISSLSFDASIYEIFPPLAAGASLHLIDDSTRLSSIATMKWLISEKITMAFLPTPLAEQVLGLNWPKKTSLRTLQVAGDILHYDTVMFRMPFSIYNLYGPTENTIATTYYKVIQHEKPSITVPIGKPINNTQLYILNKSLQPVPIGAVGELYIGGQSLARGYLKNLQLTKEKFIDNPFIPDEVLYKSGDLVRCRQEGHLEFIGRSDQQVKISGVRIEINGIETLLIQYPDIKQVAVVDKRVQGKHKYLVAYYSTYSKNEIDKCDLQQYLRKHFPETFVPNIFILIGQIPTTYNGKIDRKKLRQMDIKTRKKSNVSIDSLTTTEQSLIRIWEDVLQNKHIDINKEFFQLGGYSLTLIQLLNNIHKEFEVELSVNIFFENSTIKKLAVLIDNLRGNDQYAPRRKIIDYMQEADLSQEIQCDVKKFAFPNSPKHILITGATGFLGAFLTHEILAQTQADVYCLVRANNALEGKERIHKVFKSYGLWQDEYDKRLIILVGDLAKKQLGFSETNYAQMADIIEVIYHCAAEVNFVKPYSYLKQINVFGTEQILHFASVKKIKVVHHISSLTIFGAKSLFEPELLWIRENDDISKSAPYLKYDMGYTQSKWVAEKLIWQAQARGLPISVHRPGFILCHSKTGLANTSEYVALMLSGCVQLGYHPDLPGHRFELVTVDSIAKEIIYISCNKKSLSQAFHYTPPPSDNIDINEFFRLFNTLTSYSVKKLPYEAWLKKLIEHVENNNSPLYPLLPLLTEKTYKDLSVLELYQNTPDIGDSNTQLALINTELGDHRISNILLSTYINYLTRQKYLL